MDCRAASLQGSTNFVGILLSSMSGDSGCRAFKFKSARRSGGTGVDMLCIDGQFYVLTAIASLECNSRRAAGSSTLVSLATRKGHKEIEMKQGTSGDRRSLVC